MYNTLYIFPMTPGVSLYFSSPFSEAPEHAAHRLWRMHQVQFNSVDPAQNFFEANTDLDLALHSTLQERLVFRGYQYIFDAEGGFIAQFYHLAHLRWINFYAGPWHVFVDQFSSFSEPLHPFKLCHSDLKNCYLTLGEAKSALEVFGADPKGCSLDLDLLRTQIEALEKGGKKHE